MALEQTVWRARQQSCKAADTRVPRPVLTRGGKKGRGARERSSKARRRLVLVTPCLIELQVCLERLVRPQLEGMGAPPQLWYLRGSGICAGSLWWSPLPPPTLPSLWLLVREVLRCWKIAHQM
jgi:hypothetical protein